MASIDPQRAGAETRRFVCVHNRDRDSYQVALALQEAGLLEALVTDYYAADDVPRWWPGFLRRKRVSGLPRRQVVADTVAFLGQYAAQVLRLPMARVWRLVDARLGRTADALARKRDAGLYCYHIYMPARRNADRPLIVFGFHPLAQHYLPALRDDAARFAEARESLAKEELGEASQPVDEGWLAADAVVCASSVTARTFVAAGVAQERIAIVPYGLPSATEATEVPKQREPGPARFLFVGQGIQRKGLHHLIRAWQQRPRDGASLTIVSYSIDPAIAALVTDRSITVLGYQDRRALDHLYRTSDVFIMPSMLEGFGLVYLEALARGCHVVGTDMTGLPDLALPDGAATLVPAGDIDGLSRTIDQLGRVAVDGGLDRQAIAAAGARWTQDDFRRAIADHAARILAWRRGAAAYPAHYRAIEGARRDG